jgi:hypothetical protein
MQRVRNPKSIKRKLCLRAQKVTRSKSCSLVQRLSSRNACARQSSDAFILSTNTILDGLMARSNLLKMRIRKVDGTRQGVRRCCFVVCLLVVFVLHFPSLNSITHEVFNDPRPLRLHLDCGGGDGETVVPHKGNVDR